MNAVLAAAVGRLAGIGSSVAAFALPPRCPGCGVVTPDDHRFCLDCWMKLDFLGGPGCASCGEPFDYDPGPGARCGTCLASAPALDGMRAAVAYGDIARRIALKLKYGGRPGLAETIARLMIRLTESDEAMILVPVPLHRWRIWRRGYNQSALIARALAGKGGGHLMLDLLERRRATPILRGMGPAARMKTVRGAFAVAEGYRNGLKGRKIILVDDVYTTGATANACARALKRAGAGEVRLICWARVVRRDLES